MRTIAADLPSTRAEGRYFYVWMGVGFVLVAFGGFVPTYWAPVGCREDDADVSFDDHRPLADHLADHRQLDDGLDERFATRGRAVGLVIDEAIVVRLSAEHRLRIATRIADRTRGLIRSREGRFTACFFRSKVQ